MDSFATYWADRSALEWQVELGADEAIGDTPIDRFALEVQPPKTAKPAGAQTAPPPIPEKVVVDAQAVARDMAQQAADIPALQAAITAFDHCQLKRGARKMVFAAGNPAARVMVIGDAPNRDEDMTGTPFAGAQGALLDKMLAAIGLTVAADDPDYGAYLVAAIPWRSPGDAAPAAADMAMMRPFLERHIALANPDVVLLMGHAACQTLLGETSLSRLRGKWSEVLGRPAMPMQHPATLLTNPLAKRDAWADLLAVQAKLKGAT